MAGSDPAAQLAAIGTVLRAAGECGASVWLRGGWAMDFYLGEITREHVDIDWFTWTEDAEALAAELAGCGYRPDAVWTDAQRDFVADGVFLSFALLGRDGFGRVVVAGGDYAGAPWPDGMLDHAPGRIGELTCPIISPQAQIEIKRMMPVWMPGRPVRQKDLDDIARLRSTLS